MDYEKKYKEALSKAKELSDSNPSDEGVQKWIQDTFPELRESEDERMKKSLKRIIASFHDCNFPTPEGFTRKELFDWLEKQGEKKPADYENPNIQQNDFAPKSAMEAIKEEKVDNANKVEQKFKEGDFVVYQNQTFQVTKDSGNNLILQGRRYQTYFIEELCKPWAIDYAKDGDVLVNWNNTAFIFKAIEDKTVKFHIAYNEKWDTIKTPSTKLSHLGLPEPQFEFRPATKEQRDLLFQKLCEAGYEWDAEKKELKKIEQKPTWSEEDERIYQSIIDDTVQENQLNDKQTNWLTDIKYRYFPQPQQKPSDEHYELEEFAKIVRCNLTGISKTVQDLFEAKYLQLTGNKMYGGYTD